MGRVGGGDDAAGLLCLQTLTLNMVVQWLVTLQHGKRVHLSPYIKRQTEI
jgi:hypothetical protein